MENRQVLDSQISASSEHGDKHRAANARLNFQRPDGGWETDGWRSLGWVPKTRNGSWLQIDFRVEAVIIGVLTQARGDVPQWITSYTLSYGNDAHDFYPYFENGTEKIYSANYDNITIVNQSISPVIIARYIRIHPKSWHGSVGLRVDFSGCLKDL
ncbi:Hypothetical predicted protein [Paramuricea clavata]|uniref:Uncharacterized protein n=1 Tax=Paramuricea clavata TaxID=317549 RepID=A0A6S7HHI6_PARCT|nr:Hypothetical predicted protein [Paramuricea clavata]